MIETLPLKEYIDSRGSLVENCINSIFDEIKHFFVSKSKVNIVRGNHYHTKKAEWFYVISGKCLFVVEDINTKIREEIIISDSDNILIYNKPGFAHAFKNIGDSEMILLALINEPLDKLNPDTFEYKVL
jgi:UDP-2-acetamido-2,6-beta-L-arabino-hexul-4-ose reductase